MCCVDPNDSGLGLNGAELTVVFVAVLTPQTLHTYALLKRTVLIVTSAAAEQLGVRLAKK
jgi:hypothetical protein